MNCHGGRQTRRARRFTNPLGVLRQAIPYVTHALALPRAIAFGELVRAAHGLGPKGLLDPLSIGLAVNPVDSRTPKSASLALIDLAFRLSNRCKLGALAPSMLLVRHESTPFGRQVQSRSAASMKLI